MKDGDSLNVLKKSGLVLIEGEVNSPGYYSFKNNHSLKSYIRKAGGLTAYADKRNIYIKYPNGTSSNVKSFSSPKVKEGSIIFVNQRALASNQELSGWQVFSTISGQASSIATTLISLSLLMNQNNNGN